MSKVICNIKSVYCSQTVPVSKVIDEETGEPLVVYHGTDYEDAINEFAILEDSFGAHFGTREQATKAIRSDNDATVYPVYLSINNPIRLSDPESGFWAVDKVAKQLVAKGIVASEGWDVVRTKEPDARGEFLMSAIKNAGYDGVVYSNLREGEGDSYIAFNPSQIKSVIGNNGNFDGNNANILFSRSQTIAEKITEFAAKHPVSDAAWNYLSTPTAEEFGAVGGVLKNIRTQYDSCKSLWNKYPVFVSVSGTPSFVDQHPMPVMRSPSRLQTMMLV